MIFSMVYTFLRCFLIFFGLELLIKIMLSFEAKWFVSLSLSLLVIMFDILRFLRCVFEDIFLLQLNLIEIEMSFFEHFVSLYFVYLFSSFSVGSFETSFLGNILFLCCSVLMLNNLNSFFLVAFNVRFLEFIFYFIVISISFSLRGFWFWFGFW